ncbi:GAF domain-containing protein [Bisgaardia hudsonensis]|uniref:GAF domain-containing protein n=1 Tax=Bisgaardia hudsonensis TaxID=109472 RepID=A0A4R2MTS2_9PAST|nr:GAF domain-containing protein [Bisgaardia hudsonensis]QLB13582.1 histidine kinase [Bisgaardia hudsonensis]TCP11912.1 GAF domain-containing protein [Bisgaardia hudsonensis]
MTDYNLLFKQLQILIEDEEDIIVKMANMSSFLYFNLSDINWLGFYLVKDNLLKVGPFQGKPACSNIAKGQGVCGTAWEKMTTIVVDDVHSIQNHIACDSASNSEVVIPIIKKGNMIAELDVDSPKFSRFDLELVQFLEKCTTLI